MDLLILVFDLLLALGATLRLTRFIVSDDVPGTWFIKDPLHDAVHAHQRREDEKRHRAGVESASYPPPPRWARYTDGLGCPYCMSVWMAAVVTLTLALAGGPGDAADWWRYVAGFLTLAWLTGHIAARAGDTED
jgi:hypothetical protein